jgi:hypothetical protein
MGDVAAPTCSPAAKTSRPAASGACAITQIAGYFFFLPSSTGRPPLRLQMRPFFFESINFLHHSLSLKLSHFAQFFFLFFDPVPGAESDEGSESSRRMDGKAIQGLVGLPNPRSDRPTSELAPTSRVSWGGDVQTVGTQHTWSLFRGDGTGYDSGCYTCKSRTHVVYPPGLSLFWSKHLCRVLRTCSNYRSNLRYMSGIYGSRLAPPRMEVDELGMETSSPRCGVLPEVSSRSGDPQPGFARDTSRSER